MRLGIIQGFTLLTGENAMKTILPSWKLIVVKTFWLQFHYILALSPLSSKKAKIIYSFTFCHESLLSRPCNRRLNEQGRNKKKQKKNRIAHENFIPIHLRTTCFSVGVGKTATHCLFWPWVVGWRRQSPQSVILYLQNSS